MQSGNPSTLWLLSEFQQRYRTRTTAAFGLDSPHLMSDSLMGEIETLVQRRCGSDVVEVVAACRRLQEAALIFLSLDDLVWPITVFPAEGVYHARHDFLHGFGQGPLKLRVMAVEPAAIVPPGLLWRGCSEPAEHFRPLHPALWQLALCSPALGLLREIGGSAAYRALRRPASDRLQASGAIGHAAERLHREAASLRHIAQWPGMSVERGVQLLNALYLTSNLMVSRSHPRARAEPALAGPKHLRSAEST